MSTWRLRDVLGDEVTHVSRGLFHEHIQFGLPGYELDPLNPPLTDVEGFGGLLGEDLLPHGIDVLVDATPIGCGRDFRILAQVGRAAGIRIVAATGLYHSRNGYPHHFVGLSTEEIADVYRFELDGWRRGDATASVIKVATQRPPFPQRENRAVMAAGLAAARTGAPVICHSESVPTAREQLRLLTDGTGLAPSRVVLGHLDTSGNDPSEIADLANAGAWIGFDRFGRGELSPDSDRISLLAALAERDLLGSVLISHDAVLHHAGRGELDPPVPYNHALHFHLSVRPQLQALGFRPQQIRSLESTNFARFFGLEERTGVEDCCA